MTNKHVIQTGEFKFRDSDKSHSLDNGVINKPGAKIRLGSFADLVAEGEDPRGLMVQTANGTSRQDHRQVKTVYNVDTDRWTKNENWDGDMTGN